MNPYRERLVPPLSWWVAGAAFAAVWAWLVLVVAGPAAAVLVGLVVAALMAAALWAHGGAVVIEVDATSLRVARARLGREHVGAVEVLDAATMRRRHGPDADVRAWLMHRAYVPTGVRIVVDDPEDPTPYWLVSSRHPQALASALAPRQTPVRPPDPPTDLGGPHGQA